MGLWRLEVIPVSYIACGEDVYGGYHGLCTTDNRWAIKFDTQYLQFVSFYYRPAGDSYILLVYTYQYNFKWYSVYRWWEFSAATGERLDYGLAGPSVPQAIPQVAIAGVGSYGRVYTTKQLSRYVYECDYTYPPRAVENGWSYYFYDLPELDSWQKLQTPNVSLVNREDNILGLGWAGAKTFWFWDMATPAYLGSVTTKGRIGNAAYEDRWRVWFVTGDGYLHKVDYHRRRSELLSRVENPETEDLAYRVAFDSKRKRLAIFRVRPDAEDGACRCQIEFYRPIPRVQEIIDPVPTDPLRMTQDKIRFVSHLIGDAGEGIAPYTVQAALLEPEVGRLGQKILNSQTGGKLGVDYHPVAPAVETLELSADIEDGE